jgi:ubiquinone/menaquinone biosynthesis C-methylase UbiE
MKHRSDPKILNERTLELHHKRLAELLEPGMRVLDAGCGSGSITAGIARRLNGPGLVVGIDRDGELLDQARTAYGELRNLKFVQSEIAGYRVDDLEFDIATAARVLQWIDPPEPALESLCAAVRAGGWVVVLDYNHAAHTWEPEARPELRTFYEAFLSWREVNRWSNQIGDGLPGMFEAAGLVEIESRDETESDFERVAGLWTHMTESLGPALVKDGFLTEAQCVAGEANEAWRREEGRVNRLALRVVTGRKN